MLWEENLRLTLARVCRLHYSSFIGQWWLLSWIFISTSHVWFAWKHHSMLKKGIDRNDKTRQDSIVWKRAWQNNKRGSDRQRWDLYRMGRQNLCVSAQSWENLFTVFDLKPGRCKGLWATGYWGRRIALFLPWVFLFYCFQSLKLSALAYNHDTKNNIGPTKPLSYDNFTQLKSVVWREYSEIIGFEYCGSVSKSKVT